MLEEETSRLTAFTVLGFCAVAPYLASGWSILGGRASTTSTAGSRSSPSYRMALPPRRPRPSPRTWLAPRSGGAARRRRAPCRLFLPLYTPHRCSSPSPQCCSLMCAYGPRRDLASSWQSVTGVHRHHCCSTRGPQPLLSPLATHRSPPPQAPWPTAARRYRARPDREALQGRF